MTSLVLSIVYHVALGLALAAIVWAVGLGWFAAFAGGRPLRPAETAFGYPLGLLVVTAASGLFLVRWWLGVLALPLVLVPLAAFGRRGGGLVPRAGRPVVWGLPGTVALGVALGLLWHGPTRSVPSSAYGDMLYYASKLVSATTSVTPLHDLLVQGQTLGVVEGAATYIGGPLAHLPGFDAILFQASSLPTFMVVSLLAGLGLAGRPGAAAASRHEPDAATWAPVLGLLAVATLAYPTWVTESPPVALAVPLAIPLWALYRERLSGRAFAGLAALLAVDLFLTKGFGLIPFAVLAAFAVARDHRPRTVRQSVPYAVGGLLLVGAGAAAFFVTAGWAVRLLGLHFLPADAARGLWHERTHRDTQAAAPSLQALGEVLLVVALARGRSYAALAALGVSMAAGWLVVGHGFDIATGMSILLAALAFLERPDALLGQRYWLLAAACALTVAAWFRDITGVRAAFVLVAALAAATVLGFVRVGGLPAAQTRRVAAYGLAAGATGILLALSGRALVAFLAVAALAALSALVPPAGGRRLAGAVTAVALVGAAGVALVAANRGRLELVTARTTLTSSDFAVWKEVRHVVPRNALVFTSLTGPKIEGDQGWNYYPGVFGRQVYLAGWSNSALHVRRAELRRRLRVNDEVLRGRITPERAVGGSSFRSYWAVVRVAEAVPPSFRRVYANGGFALYAISSR